MGAYFLDSWPGPDELTWVEYLGRRMSTAWYKSIFLADWVDMPKYDEPMELPFIGAVNWLVSPMSVADLQWNTVEVALVLQVEILLIGTDGSTVAVYANADLNDPDLYLNAYRLKVALEGCVENATKVGELYRHCEPLF
jgi:hypothetical protein